MYILVKNHGYDGLSVHGITLTRKIAQVWVDTDPVCNNEVIEIHDQDSVSITGMKSTRNPEG